MDKTVSFKVTDQIAAQINEISAPYPTKAAFLRAALNALQGIPPDDSAPELEALKVENRLLKQTLSEYGSTPDVYKAVIREKNQLAQINAELTQIVENQRNNPVGLVLTPEQTQFLKELAEGTDPVNWLFYDLLCPLCAAFPIVQIEIPESNYKSYIQFMKQNQG